MDKAFMYKMCKDSKNFKDGFILIETLQGLVLCACALSLCFMLAPLMSHKFALAQANFASGGLYPQLLHSKASTLELSSANKHFIFSHHTFSKQDSALPFMLHYLQVTSVR